jgi:hypothetical protein
LDAEVEPSAEALDAPECHCPERGDPHDDPRSRHCDGQQHDRRALVAPAAHAPDREAHYCPSAWSDLQVARHAAYPYSPLRAVEGPNAAAVPAVVGGEFPDGPTDPDPGTTADRGNSVPNTHPP